MLTHHWEPYTHHSEFSGIERLIYYISKMYDVDVLTWKFGKIREDTNTELSVKRVFTPPSDIFLERRLLISAAAFQYGNHYDLIHALYSIPAFFPSFRYPTVATIHITSDINKKSIWLRYKTILQKVVFKKAKCLIAVSTNLKEILEEKYHVRNVIYIPLGVDTQHFYPETQNEKEKETLLNERFKFISLTTGIVGTKILFIFKIAEQFSNVLFVVLGKEYYPHPPNVRFLSGISENELKNLYNIADIFLKPLKFATANNSILEAMAMAKPIITDAIPGVLDYLDEKCAYLVSKRKDYPEIIRHVLENENERKLKGKKAREKAKREFEWSIIARKVSKVYESIIKT